MNLELEPSKEDEEACLIRWRGRLIDNSSARSGRNGIAGFLSSIDDAAFLLSEPLNVLGESFSSLTIFGAFDWTPTVFRFSEDDCVDFSLEFGPDIWGLEEKSTLRFPILKCKLNLWTEDWANHWSVNAFADAFVEQLNRVPAPGVRGFIERSTSELKSPGFLLEANSSVTLKAALSKCRNLYFRVMDSLEERLLGELSPERVLSIFRFPPEFEVPCKQYLIYFIQFLRDLGIDATGDLWHQGVEVLFSISPKSPEDGLERIRSALSWYLQLPGQRNLSQEFYEYDGIAVRQLEANVLHLRSQLTLASAVIEAKDETISTLRFLVADKMSPQDREALVHGVEVTPYSRAGIRLDLPAILRRLKRVFSNDSG